MKIKQKRWKMWFAVAILGVAWLGVRWSNTRSAASGLGVVDGSLADCPGSPNCVCTEASAAKYRIEPLPLEREPAETLALLRDVLESLPRTTVIAVEGNYLHAECRSRAFGFVDDVEFLVDERAGEVQMRSAARIGHWDLGVNRRRLEKVRSKYAAKLME